MKYTFNTHLQPLHITNKQFNDYYCQGHPIVILNGIEDDIWINMIEFLSKINNVDIYDDGGDNELVSLTTTDGITYAGQYKMNQVKLKETDSPSVILFEFTGFFVRDDVFFIKTIEQFK